MSKIVITIDEPFNQVNCCNCAKVLIIREDGKKRSRIVTMESLLKAMKGSTAHISKRVTKQVAFVCRRFIPHGKDFC